MLESIPFGFIQVDLNGQIVYANKSAFKLLELEADRLIGLPYDKLPWDQLNEDYTPLNKEQHTIYQALKGETSAGVVRVLRIKNNLKWFSVSTSPFYDDSGLLIGAISNFVDITQKAEIEFKSQERQKRCEKLIEEAPCAITIYNKEGLLIKANKKCKEYWEIPVSDCIGKFNLFKSEIFNHEKAKKCIDDAFQGNEGEITTAINLPHLKDGERHFRINYYSLFDKKGAFDKVVCFIKDATKNVFTSDNKKGEEILKQEILNALRDGIIVVNREDEVLNIKDKNKRLSDRLLLATEIANLGVWEYDIDSDEIYWGSEMYAIFSDFQDPIPRSEIKDMIIGEDKNFLDEKLALIEDGINFFEAEVTVKVGHTFKYVRTFTKAIRRENGSLKGIVGVVYDITKDKELQNELETSLDEKNILVKEIHHRVKNNMQLISSILALKAHDLKDENSKILFKEINTRIKTMSVIYDRLYKFHSVSEIDIKDFLTNIAQQLYVLLSTSEIAINVEVIPENVTIDQALLIGLIVSEMVSNAIKHSFGERSKGTIEIQLNKRKQGKYYLSVTNDGRKISNNVLSGNIGLGLSLIKTFAKQLNGTLSIDEKNGFKVEF
ncbi:MAG: histidine kinase dimerization/phosphoacceptor domain -containing protein [Bacteroidota bacterium]